MNASDKPRVVFVVRDWKSRWPEIDALGEASIAGVQGRIRSGIDAWIVQGYLRLRDRLRQLGFDVSISEAFPTPPGGAICIAHRDDLNRYGDSLYDCYVIGVRADRPPLRVAQIEIVQNGLDLSSPRSRFIPSWPQPGLKPRDAVRGACVERVAYMGRDNSLPPWYRDGSFIAALASMGIALDIRERAWNNYSDVDVLIAHRDETPVMLRQKPAAKLVNAWLAGVPALLAPEPAYLELRESPLDFMEATDADTALRALRELRADPALYHAMVENGRKRARAFTGEAIAARWMDLIIGDAMPAFEAWRRARPSWPVRYAGHLRDMSAQKILAKGFRRRQRSELRDQLRHTRSG